MQTFLPYSDFKKSVECLDRQRLGKQRVEARDILVILLGKPSWCSDKYFNYLKKRYFNHPAVLQWTYCELCLYQYTKAVCNEWVRRGYEENCLKQANTIFQEIKNINPDDFGEIDSQNKKMFPWWLGNPYFHMSHRAALLYKNIKHYKQFGWDELPKIRYCWLVTKNNFKIHESIQLNNGKTSSEPINFFSNHNTTISLIGNLDDPVFVYPENNTLDLGSWPNSGRGGG